MNAGPVWRTPSELVTLGFARSRVVMINEAHDGLKRCVRTRKVGKGVLGAAHDAGVRKLAMEALAGAFADECNTKRKVPPNDLGYLGQPEMRELMQAALGLGWTLVPYEASSRKWLDGAPGRVGDATTFMSMEYSNWREVEQARNLVAVLAGLPKAEKLLVWCGNGHNRKDRSDEWYPMALRFREQSGVDPFCVDQIPTVRFTPGENAFAERLLARHADALGARGGTAGFLREEGDDELREHPEDAFILSTDNELV